MRALVPILAGAMTLAFMASPAAAYDYTEANDCADCHFYPGDAVMQFTVDKWKESSHAQSHQLFLGNTYCASCHAPFQADPAATSDENAAVPLAEWEAVTCSSCHPPHDLRVEWGTPIGTYDVDTAAWSPVYEDEANLLCENCHSGSRHEQEFQGFGKAMSHKGVRCIDCHMAAIPNDADPGRLTRNHSFNVGASLPYSCGVGEGGCHSNHTEDWAAKQIAKGKLHGKVKNH